MNIVTWTIVGVLAVLLLCLFVSVAVGGRRRYPAPTNPHRKDVP